MVRTPTSRTGIGTSSTRRDPLGGSTTWITRLADKRVLTLEGAKKAAAAADAKQHAEGAAIAIVDDGGNLPERGQ
jgi:hypothetical protein